MRKALYWIGGILAAVFIGAFFIDRRHTYEARLRQVQDRREQLESEAEVVGKAIAANEHRTAEKEEEIRGFEKKRVAIKAKAAKLRKTEVS